MKLSNKIVTSLVAGSLGTLAHATPVTMSETVTLNDLLTNQSTTIHYDASNLLAGQGLTRNDAQSATLIVYGLSDASYQTSADPYGAYFQTGSHTRAVQDGYTYWQQGVYTSYYSCGWLGHSTCSNNYVYYYPVNVSWTDYFTDTTYMEQRNIEHRDTQDKMTVSVGNTTASAVDSVVAHSEGAYSAPQYQGGTGYQYGNNSTYYSQERDVYDSVTGSLQVSLALDALALQSLIDADTGYLDINVSALGHFTLQSLGVSMTGEAPARSNSDVPEPASIVLSLTGMAAFAATRRRKKPART